MNSDLGKELSPRLKEWLKYLKDRLKAIENIFSWIMVVSGIVIPLLIGQLFMVFDNYIVSSSGGLDLSAINHVRVGSLFGTLIIFVILVYRAGDRAFEMRSRIIGIIHEILAEKIDITEIERSIDKWKKDYLNWRFLYDKKDQECHNDQGVSTKT